MKMEFMIALLRKAGPVANNYDFATVHHMTKELTDGRDIPVMDISSTLFIQRWKQHFTAKSAGLDSCPVEMFTLTLACFFHSIINHGNQIFPSEWRKGMI